MRLPQLSLTHLALAAIGLVLACSMALGGSLLWHHYAALSGSARTLARLDAFRIVLDAANEVSAERGPTNAALGRERTEPDPVLLRLRAFRKVSDAAIARIPPSLAPAVAPFRQKLAQARAQVDALLAQPLARRDRDEVEQAIVAMFAAYDATQPLTDAAMDKLLAGEPALIGAALIARMLGELRDNAGRLGSYLVIAIVHGQPLAATARVAFDETRGRTLELWRLIGSQTATHAAATVVQAHRDVEQRFFDKGFGLIEQTRAQLDAGRHPGTPEEFTDALVPSFAPIEQLRGDFIASVVEALDTTYRHTRADFILAAIGLVLVLAVELLLLFASRRFLLGPLMLARARVTDLANGRLSQAAAPRQLRSEMRDLFQALETLRHRLIEREQLDAERLRLTARLRLQADTDGLTGVLNRGALERLVRKIAAAPEPDRQVGLILLDIDHFKAINDEFGHIAGDAALRALARRLQEGLREQDVIARFGGEEFAILVLDDGASDAEALSEVAERLRRRIEASPVGLDTGAEVAITASLGVATAPAGPEMWPALLEAADAALYRAKRDGRNRVVTEGWDAPLEQRAGQDRGGDAEIDDEAGDVDQRRHEGRRGAGRIEAQTFQREGQHRTGERAEGDDT